MTNRDPSRRPERSEIPVICDHCLAHGRSGEDPFRAFGKLLDFEPVPRFSKRPDGWDAELQRVYIAALALTGSDRAACRAVGKAQYGVTQLLKHEGSEGFRAARDEAIAIATDERSHRLRESLNGLAAEESEWRPADPPWANAASRSLPAPAAPPPEEEDYEEEEEEELSTEAEDALSDALIRIYLVKVQQERIARLAGKIIEADHYVRQMSWFEAVIDLVSDDGFKLLSDFRIGGHNLIDIAETPMSRLLGEMRRAQWAEMGDPPRPEHPPRRYLRDHGRYSTEPVECTWGGLEKSHEEQQREFEERHRQDAEAQLAWEAEARRDYERRRSAESKADDAQQRPALVERSEAAAGVPSEGEDTSDVTDSLRDGPSADGPPNRSSLRRRRGEGDRPKGGGGAGRPAAGGDSEGDRE